MEKLGKLGSAVWSHKKKAALAAIVAAYGVNWRMKSRRDARIRHCYAQEARKYGDAHVSHPLEKMRKVLVLMNRTAGGGKASELFKTNALPLLNLAGLEVDIVEVKSSEEMHSLGAVTDTKDADCVYLVGGDGTLMRYLSGAFGPIETTGKGRRHRSPPLAIFPAGRENRSLAGLEPQLYRGANMDVRSYCESAMALIENTLRQVSPARCELETTREVITPSSEKSLHTEVFHTLDGVRAGWLEHCEQRKWKLWYWGALRGYICYLMEFIKRSPRPMLFNVEYQEFCGGCNKCKEPAKPVEKPKWNWMHLLVRPTRTTTNKEKPADYSNVVNSLCGVRHVLENVKTSDMRIDVSQSKSRSKLHFKKDGDETGRFRAIAKGWQRSGNREDDSGRELFEANEITLHVKHMPDYINKIYVSGDASELNGSKATSMKVSTSDDERIQVFLPSLKRNLHLE